MNVKVFNKLSILTTGLSLFLIGCGNIIDFQQDLTEKSQTVKKELQSVYIQADEFKSSCGNPLIQTDKNSNDSTLEDVIISIYIDGTLSMGSYVHPSLKTTRYVNTLIGLNEAASSASDKKYYKFGKIAEEIGENDYISAYKEQFYIKNNSLPDFEVALIESAILPPSKNNLYLIVTDLYQKDTDFSNIKEKLEKYLDKNYAVGILAVKSEFKGIIYDVGIQEESFSYSTEGKTLDQYRPFYVIMLGDYSQIKSYYDTLKSVSSSFLERSHFHIFTSNIVTKTSYFEESFKFTDSLGKKLFYVNNGKIQIKNANLPYVSTEKLNANRFQTRNSEQNSQNEDQDNELTYTIPYYYSDYTLKVDTQKDNLKFETQVKVFDGENNSSLKNALNLDSLIFIDNYNFGGDTETNQAISFVTKLNSDEISQGIYGYIIDIIPKKLQEPEWWSNWNSDDNTQDGSKTHNIRRFLQGLKYTVEQDLTSIGRFCYIVQKN